MTSGTALSGTACGRSAPGNPGSRWKNPRSRSCRLLSSSFSSPLSGQASWYTRRRSPGKVPGEPAEPEEPAPRFPRRRRQALRSGSYNPRSRRGRAVPVGDCQNPRHPQVNRQFIAQQPSCKGRDREGEERAGEPDPARASEVSDHEDGERTGSSRTSDTPVTVTGSLFPRLSQIRV